MSYKFSILLIFLTSCDFLEIPEKKATKNLLLVNSFISPQDTILSVELFDIKENSFSINNKNYIKEADVVISDKLGNFLNLKFNSLSNTYFSRIYDFKVLPGQEYFLTIVTKEFGRVVASCIVPKILGSYDYIIERNNRLITIKGVWSNLISNMNYIINSNFYNCDESSCKLIANLNNSDNLKYLTNQKITDDIEILNQLQITKNLVVEAKISAIDNNTAAYLNAIRKNRAWSLNIENLIPNLTEAPPIYTNIEGGVGIFGAYNSISIKINNVQ